MGKLYAQKKFKELIESIDLILNTNLAEDIWQWQQLSLHNNDNEIV